MICIRASSKRARSARIRAYELAWARLQHEQPGYAQAQIDQAFEAALVGWLRFHEGMLIGEIIPYAYRYLRDNPAAPERDLYDHVLVDEFQDLNKAEQAVIDLLCTTADLCIVGDDDQSLYSFKFAHPAGIREFPAAHQITTDHEILECRRCPTRVVQMANALIAQNHDRDERALRAVAANGAGEISILQYQTLEHEAAGIAAADGRLDRRSTVRATRYPDFGATAFGWESHPCRVEWPQHSEASPIIKKARWIAKLPKSDWQS